MNPIPALHVRIEGLTASFCFPLIKSGTQVNVPVPPYSTLLGIISACAGRIVKHTETRIGFEFWCRSMETEIERKDRLELKGGKLRRLVKKNAPKDLRPHLRISKEGISGFLEEIPQGVGLRQVYWYPRLDLYLTNQAFRSAFENPAAPPTLGRSQDVAWIVFVREKIEIHPRKTGEIGPTLLPKVQVGVPGLIVRAPEWIDNSKKGHVRQPGPFGVYQGITPLTKNRFAVTGEDFYHPSDAENENDVIYLHKWLKE
jgi:CRISPR-associated protein Cas5t